MAEEHSGTCPICGAQAKYQSPVGSGKHYYYGCPRCNEYVVGFVQLKTLEAKPFHEKYLLCSLIREFADRDDRFEIPDNKTVLEIVSGAVPTTVPEKLQHLLRRMAHRSPHPGARIRFVAGEDFPIGYCVNDEELALYLRHLRDLGYISYDRDSGGTDCCLTAPGWAEVEAQQVPNIESEKAFVAMWFDDSMGEVWENGFEPGIKKAGYKPTRMGKGEHAEHVDKIDDRIIAAINESRFVVADFTAHRNNVYYESGYAMGHGLPVIWTCHKDHINDSAFDTRQYNHIVWETPEDLCEQLDVRIRAVVGPGPEAP